MSDWGSTNRLPAHVALVDGAVLDGDLHLLTRPAYPPGGSETPLEMLNRPDPFFALTLAGGDVALVPKTRVGSPRPRSSSWRSCFPRVPGIAGS